MNTKRVIIVGIPGVGKTTVMDKIKDILNSKGIITKYVIFGSIMMKEAEKLGVKNRDDMRKLPLAQQKKLQITASSEISKIHADVLLIDTHLFIKTNDGYWPGIPYDVAKTIFSLEMWYEKLSSSSYTKEPTVNHQVQLPKVKSSSYFSAVTQEKFGFNPF